MAPTCPECGHQASKVIYLGLPMKLCLDPDCSTIWGLFSWVAVWLPIPTPDGEGFCFLTYEENYWPALWYWIRTRDEDVD